MTECLIKAVELRLEDTGVPLPAKPDNLKERASTEQYTAQMETYDRQADACLLYTSRCV